MGSLLQVCLYNTDKESSEELRGHITSMNFVRLVAEVENPDDLAAALANGGINLLFLHLDPVPDEVVELIEQVTERFPALAMIGISHQTGPDAILAPIRAGCDQFVCEPIDYAELASAVSRVASKRLLTRGQSRCICVSGASGGAGATSIACNLAMEIAHLTERECALVDLDLQFGDVAINMDCEPQYTIFDLAQAGGELDRTILANVLTELPGGVPLLARPRNLDQFQSITPELVHHTIEVLTTMHENVVVDMPRRIDPCTFAALSQADLVLVVCQLLVPSIRNAKRYQDALTHAGIPGERIEVVVNRGDSTGGRITVKDLEDLVKKPPYATVPNDYHCVARSLDFGRPIAMQSSNNPVRNAMRKLAAKIVGDTASAAVKNAAGKGFLSRLLSK